MNLVMLSMHVPLIFEYNVLWFVNSHPLVYIYNYLGTARIVIVMVTFLDILIPSSYRWNLYSNGYSSIYSSVRFIISSSYKLNDPNRYCSWNEKKRVVDPKF